MANAHSFPLTASVPAWSHYAVPAATLAATALLFKYRGTLVSLVSDWVARGRGQVAGKQYLSGNFGPVQDELFAEDLRVVQGAVPADLDGCYVRTGPNPLHPPVAGYHWFDGDGMLHAVRIRGGKASYCNRYVDTSRLQQERAAGRPLFLRMGDLFGKRGLLVMALGRLAHRLGVTDERYGAGTANTALVYHARRLLALNEGDLPYGIKVLCNGVLDTLGRLVFDKRWDRPFTAHPKKDVATDELVFIGYSMERAPYVRVGVLDAEAALTRSWGVELPYPVMMHDMAATQRYAVLLHLPLCFDPKLMVERSTLPFVLRKELPGRFGLLRRDAPSAERDAPVQWFEVPGPGFMAFHVAASFEDAAGRVKVYACQMDSLTLDLDAVDCSQELARLTEYVLDPATGQATARRMTEVHGDFPVINPAYSTQPCRYAWVAVMDPAGSMPSFTGIAKMDLTAPPGTDACVARIAYPPGHYGGEAVFVARGGDAAAARARGDAEDDGYLAVYVYSQDRDSSALHLYNARTMDSKPVAVVAMPRRVPYGFHGTFVSGQELAQQYMWV